MCMFTKVLVWVGVPAIVAGFGAVMYVQYSSLAQETQSAPSAAAKPKVTAKAAAGGCCCAAKGKACKCGSACGGSEKIVAAQPVSAAQTVGMFPAPTGALSAACGLAATPAPAKAESAAPAARSTPAP